MAELDDKVIVTKSKITDIADALREEMSESYEYSLPTMVEKVHELGQGQGSEYTAGVGIDITNRVVSVVDTLMIRGESSGSVASISDGGANMPLKSCIVAIEPVQSGSGDPSPSNVRPITGWTECNLTRCGKNLAKLTYGDKVPSTSTGEMVSSNGWSSDFFELDKTKSYVVSTTASSRYIMFYDESKTYLGYIATYANGYVLNSNQYWANAKYIKHRSDAGSGTAPDIQLEVGSTATDYEQYQGNTYNIEFPSEAGTVYGGTLDVTNGVLIVDRVYFDLGDANWFYSSPHFQLNNVGDLVGYKGNNICSCYVKSSVNNISVQQDDLSYVVRPTFIVIRDNSFSGDASAFKTARSGEKIVVELATPQTYNLTPTEVKTLLGINNIFADCGDVDVEYVRDATLIINKLLELVSGNNNRTMMKSAVVEKTDEVKEQKKDSVEENLDA